MTEQEPMGTKVALLAEASKRHDRAIEKNTEALQKLTLALQDLQSVIRNQDELIRQINEWRTAERDEAARRALFNEELIGRLSKLETRLYAYDRAAESQAGRDSAELAKRRALDAEDMAARRKEQIKGGGLVAAVVALAEALRQLVQWLARGGT